MLWGPCKAKKASVIVRGMTVKEFAKFFPDSNEHVKELPSGLSEAVVSSSIRSFSDRLFPMTSLRPVDSEALRFGSVVSILLPRELQHDCKNNLPDTG